MFSEEFGSNDTLQEISILSDALQPRQQSIVALLCDDREIDEYTRDFSGQRLSKHVPAATNRRATTEVVLETGCFCVFHTEELQGRHLGRQSRLIVYTEVCGERTSALQAEESPLLKSVTRKCLLETLQAGEDLACSDL
jgi:hypothetical protein